MSTIGNSCARSDRLSRRCKCLIITLIDGYLLAKRWLESLNALTENGADKYQKIEIVALGGRGVFDV